MNKQSSKKLISIVVPVYNEQDCLEELYCRTTEVMQRLAKYEYEIVYFDDGSTDRSREMIAAFCRQDKHCKAVLFAHNYGYNTAIFYAVEQAKGDCAFLLHADLQNPPELIPEFTALWEQGHDAVFGVKNKSKESKLMYAMRSLAYRVFNTIFKMRLIPHATDFELIDKSIIAALHSSTGQEPILRLQLQQKAQCAAKLYYTQDRRAAGRSAFTITKYLKLAMSWIKASRRAGACHRSKGQERSDTSRAKEPLTIEEKERINY